MTTVAALLGGSLVGLSAVAGAAVGDGPPAATGQVAVAETIVVDGEFDGGLQQFSGVGDGGQDEGQDPLFEVADGGVVRNVLIGAPGDDGIHCLGSCTLDNVWWIDVGEDALTAVGDSADTVVTIENGGAFLASDKVFQHNGAGTMIIRNMEFADVGKVYRSCGNCSTQFARTAVISDIVVRGEVTAVAGVNTNLGDRATLSGITLDTDDDVDLCELFLGNDTGDEPELVGTEPDGVSCTVS
ncbi:pectate lyase [Pseudonocardia sp. S2-4]|uniref:Pectate lyase n=1 Tax=Pseudonocardia humida TaxID=2800819 RepID=A0ABT1A5C0_9PSEU|nr:pectate lyase [Pseudonocardia humida]